MPAKNFLKEKLKSGRPVIGTWSVIPSEVVADIVSSSGVDFIVLDQEHGPAGFETAQRMALACEARGVSPALRVGGAFPAEILRALEIGIHCLHVPNVTGAGQLAEVISACKYPPAGARGFSPFTRAGGWSHKNFIRSRGTARRAPTATLLAVHIESPEALENLEEILKAKEADVVFIGRYDLSKSLGLPGGADGVRMSRLVSDLTRRILRAGKIPGTIVTDGRQLKKMLRWGMRYLTYSADCEMLLRSYQVMLST